MRLVTLLLLLATEASATCQRDPRGNTVGGSLGRCQNSVTKLDRYIFASQYKTIIPGPWVGLLAVLLEDLRVVLSAVLWEASFLW